MLLQRHRAIFWYAFGVALLHSRGWGGHALCETGFEEFLCRDLFLSFKLSVPRGLCLAGCGVVAQTQGYHLVCIWGR